VSAVEHWFKEHGWRAQPFQREVWAHMAAGHSGLLNAPTGSGKTYAVWGGVVNAERSHPRKVSGLRAIWITPLRALAGEIADSAQPLMVPDSAGRSASHRDRAPGTCSPEEKPSSVARDHARKPACSGHEGLRRQFKQLDWFIADEWRELLGSKRSVQVELARAD
jgi:ATP-dependent Lhr-like helicase